MTAPKQFVGLHAHSNFSTFDGLGYPDEHQAFAVENGLDAHALTDHGNMNGFPHAEQNARALNKKGVKFKFLPGVEAYYHPDLSDWRKSHAAAAEARKAAKKSEIVEDDVGVTVENEEETKDTSRPADPIRRRHHMVLLAKSQRGLQNMFQLVSRSYNEGFYKFPRIDRAMLKEHGEDIVVTSACIGGALAYDVNEALRGCPTRGAHELDDPARMEVALRSIGNTVDQITDAVGVENFFPEIQFNKLDMQHTVNRALLEFSKRNGLKPVATADSHYCRPELWIEREIYKKLGRLKFEQIDPSLMPKDKSQLKCELYPKNAPQMWETYNEVKQGYDWYDDEVICGAIERTWDIAHSLIGNPSPDTSMKLPKFLVPEGLTPLAYLIELCKTGIKEKGLHTKKEYVDRLRAELETIKTKDFALYFITMKSIIDIAKSKMIVGPGRGSAAGSLVCFILGITTIDPIKYGLLFERFISPSRKDSPDVDSDCADRDTLVKSLRTSYGEENVYPILNINTLQLKSLVKDISKMHGIPFEEVNEATKRLDEDVRHKAMPEGENKSLFMLKYDDCMQYSEPFRKFISEHPEVGDHVKVLYRQPRGLGKHAGGVIVTQDASKHMPLIAAGGEMRTPWVEGMNRKDLEVYGLIKFDLLGLETLRIIENCARLILKRHEGVKNPTWDQVRGWVEKNLDPETMDLNDQRVYENVFIGGKFAGTFQFTAKHTQKFIKAFQPRSIRDLSVATSIYRPGPLAAKVDKLYIDKKNRAANGETFKYDHPAIEKVLGPTFGFPVFQEQLMQLAAELSSFTPDECDKLRKTILKRSVQAQAGQKGEVQKLEDKFIDGAVANGLSRDKAQALFEDLAAFASYGFNCCLHAKTSVTVYNDRHEPSEKCIVDVQPGDIVRSRDEATGEEIYTEVVANHSNGVQELFEVELDDGSILKCTMNHKFRTKCGQMLPLSQIIEKDLEIVTG